MATLTVTITESLPDYNGVSNDLALSNSVQIAGVNDIYHRIVTCPSGAENTTLVSFKQSGATAADGAIARDNVAYIRVTNLDHLSAGTPVILNLQVIAAMNDAVGDQNAGILLEAGKSFMMGKISDAIELTAGVDDIDAVADLHDLESIMADPLAAAVQLEIFVAMKVT